MCTIIEFLKQLDLEQALVGANKEQIEREYLKHLNSLSRNQVLPQFAREPREKTEEGITRE